MRSRGSSRRSRRRGPAAAPSSWSRGRPASARRRCSGGATAAADHGMRVLSARGTELERDFSFGVVRQLFEPVLVEADEHERANLLDRRCRRGGRSARPARRACRRRRAGARVDPSFAILHGLYWLCANLAAATPLCLVVDDAHWADAAVAPLPRLPPDASRGARRRARRGDAPARGRHRRGAARNRHERSLRRRDPPSASDESGGRPARGVAARGHARSRLRRCALPRDEGHAVPRARARGGVERTRHTGDRGGRAARGEDRRANDRPFHPSPAQATARSLRGGLRALSRFSSRATCSSPRASRISTRPTPPTRPSCS